MVRKRRMVRNYESDQRVDRAIVNDLLELAIRAPSAGFSQGWHFLVLDSDDSRETFWSASTDPDAEPDSWLRGLKAAPTLVLALSDKQAYLDRYAESDKGWSDRSEDHWPIPYWDVDTGMASMLLLLGAVDRGLATCFFGVPVEAHGRVKQALGVPDRLRIVGVISLGYAAPDRRSPSLARGRRSLDDVVSYQRFT